MPMGAMRGLPRGDARRSNCDATRGGEGSKAGAEVVEAETGADVAAVVDEVGESVRVGATSPASAKASFSACPIPSCWPAKPSSFLPLAKMPSPSVVNSSASLATGAPGDCGADCCGGIAEAGAGANAGAGAGAGGRRVLLLFLCAPQVEWCGNARRSRVGGACSELETAACTS